MGFDVNGVRFLLGSRSRGVCFDRTAMIGRQRLQLDLDALKHQLKRFQADMGDNEIHRIWAQEDRYSEPFLRMLGASHICSIDASSYEGATHIHDMNLPVPDALKNSFSVVIDGGSLEHVFNFPTAIRSCMEMLKVGGHFLGITPTNNFMGHGFYQFSPELYFRIFSAQNGFTTEQIILFEVDGDAQWFQVSDPEDVGKRVELVNSKPTYLLVRAKKLEDVPVFKTVPQQSDYSTRWDIKKGN